jgi:hypothetical protein
VPDTSRARPLALKEITVSTLKTSDTPAERIPVNLTELGGVAERLGGT